MRPAWRVWPVLPGWLALAAGLGAQTLPVPTLPEEPDPTLVEEAPPGAGALPGDKPGLARPQPWEYSAGLGLGWDGNIAFQVPDGPSDYALSPRGALARLWRSRRGELRASVAGRWIGYAEEESQSRGYADLGLEGTYRSSPGTVWKAGASYGFGHTDSSQPLWEQGVLLPLVSTRTVAGTLGLSWQAAERTTLKIDARVYSTNFDSPDLVDGRSGRGTATLERRFGTRHTASVVYSLERTDDPSGQSYLSHFGSLQWSRVLTPHSALLLEGGASYTADALRAGLDHETAFFGGVSLRREVGRGGLTAFLRREVAPAFGTGSSQLELRAGLTATRPLGADWELRAAAVLVRPDSTTQAVGIHASGDEVSAALVRWLGERLEVSGQASYRRRGAVGGLGAIEAFRAGVFLTLSSGRTRPATSR